MAAPTAPDLDSILTEGIKQAGYTTPSTTQKSRAEEWMAQTKNDIWLLGKKLKPLMAEHVEILNGGQGRYDFPSGFSSLLTAECLYGDEVDDVGGSDDTTHVELDSDDEDMGDSELIGREVVIYSGTGKGEVSQITAYDEDTYIATVFPAWATQPVDGDTYFIVDEVIPLDLRTLNHFREISQPFYKSTPRILYQVGDEDSYGYFYVYPTPYEEYYYAVRLTYFLNLLTLDLASTRMATLYHRWRNLWTQGVLWRQLFFDDDGRWQTEKSTYFSMVRDTVRLETYGRETKPSITGVRA